MKLKQSKMHVVLLCSLGVLVASQLCWGLYKVCTKEDKSQKVAAVCTQGTTALSYGLLTPKEKNFSVSCVNELDGVFKQCSYDLKSGKAVPRLHLTKLPRDMKKKKRSSNETFIMALLPHILKVNEEILNDRERLLDMQKRVNAGGHLRHSEKLWLSKLSSEYRCKSTKIEALLAHVDVIPPSLALAQAILETGGGRSHAAIHKNSTFGHMATKTKVAAFPSLLHNVQAYAKNLNRHKAYADFRKRRNDLRNQGKSLCGIHLAGGLEKYSVRKGAYIKEVRGLINSFNLKKYDKMNLEQSMVEM